MIINANCGNGHACGDPDIHSLNYAPFPHWQANPPQGYEKCITADTYHWTETGILYDKDDLYPDNQKGKDGDYETFITMARNCYVYNNPTVDFIVAGVHYHAWYDLEFDNQGHPQYNLETQQITQNWGLVNPKVKFSYSWSQGQYENIIQNLGKINACAQMEVGGFVWNNTSYTCE